MRRLPLWAHSLVIQVDLRDVEALVHLVRAHHVFGSCFTEAAAVVVGVMVEEL